MWKDTTSYSQGDTNRTPTAFTKTKGRLSVTVTCGYIGIAPEWVMHCYILGINIIHMPECKSEEEAKARAIKIMKVKIAELSASADEF
jgi:hypothetical protein